MVIRASAVCLYNGKLLLVKQTFTDMGSFWSLPGGKVEDGESLGEAAIRETKEETGITIRLGRLLYVSQRFVGEKHIVQVIFEGQYVSGRVGKDLSLTPLERVESVRFIPINELQRHGITKEFSKRVHNNFPDAGSYHESMEAIGL